MLKKIYGIKKERIVDVYIFISISTYLAYYISKYHFGYLENHWIFFFDTTDHFADTLKIIYSFSDIFTIKELINLNVPDIWIYHNPYNDVLVTSTTRAMSLPPLTIIFLTVSGHLAKFIGFDYRVILIIYTLLLIVLLLKIFSKQLKLNRKLIFILFSFPFLHLIERGNLMAAIAGLCLFYVMRNFILNKELDYYDLIAFVISCSMRPNYLIFGLLFLFKKNTKSNLLEFLKVGIAYLLSNGLLFFVSPSFLKGYNFNSFTLMLTDYFESHLKFDAWNSSLHGSINNLYLNYRNSDMYMGNKTIGDLIHRIIFNPNLHIYLIIFYMTVLIISFSKIQRGKINKFSFLIILCSYTALTTSPFGDYHLIIFIFLFFFIYDYSSNFEDSAISLLLISIILLPKLHAFHPENVIVQLNFSNLINTIMLNLLIIIHIWKQNLNIPDKT